ncbi:unnamed protein product, partial [Heterosigma akashiwo]
MKTDCWQKKKKKKKQVGARAPREAELATHLSRAQRYARGLADRHAAQEAAFAAAAAGALGRCRAFEGDLAALAAALPGKDSLAALQGVETRQRRLVGEFQADMEARLGALGEYAGRLPEGLLAGCEKMVAECRTFDEGGDYDATEVRFLRAALRPPCDAVRATAEARRGRIQEQIATQVETSLGGLGAYRSAYADAQLELALREGLGQKYGAPRRTAQEQLRTEITRDEAAAALVDRLLDELASL